jgi:hypothetical protein
LLGSTSFRRAPPQQQLAFKPMNLSLMVTVFMFICGGQRFSQGI